MTYYLVDTSAFVYAIENLDTIKNNFFLAKANGSAFLYMPQFCVPEVLNTFARFFYRNKKIGGELYTKWRNEFIKTIKNRRVIYCYDLHRYHNLNSGKIYKLEHTTPYEGAEKSLSTLDILVIAMGMELKQIHHPNDVCILTRDRRMIKISSLDTRFPQAKWFK